MPETLDPRTEAMLSSTEARPPGVDSTTCRCPAPLPLTGTFEHTKRTPELMTA